jgi:hypothetical protein
LELTDTINYRPHNTISFADFQNEIVVQQPTVMENAQPVLSVVERLRRSDKMIMAALAEKHRILAELLANDEVNQPLKKCH